MEFTMLLRNVFDHLAPFQIHDTEVVRCSLKIKTQKDLYFPLKVVVEKGEVFSPNSIRIMSEFLKPTLLKRDEEIMNNEYNLGIQKSNILFKIDPEILKSKKDPNNTELFYQEYIKAAVKFINENFKHYDFLSEDKLLMESALLIFRKTTAKLNELTEFGIYKEFELGFYQLQKAKDTRFSKEDLTGFIINYLNKEHSEANEKKIKSLLHEIHEGSYSENTSQEHKHKLHGTNEESEIKTEDKGTKHRKSKHTLETQEKEALSFIDLNEHALSRLKERVCSIESYMGNLHSIQDRPIIIRRVLYIYIYACLCACVFL